MLFRKTVFALALAGAAIPAAFAESGSAPLRGEQGFETHATQSTKSRADVQRELADFRKNPMTAEGGMFTQGETGYVFPQHSYDFKGGKLVHSDTIDHNKQKPSLAMNHEERHAFRKQYSN